MYTSTCSTGRLFFFTLFVWLFGSATRRGANRVSTPLLLSTFLTLLAPPSSMILIVDHLLSKFVNEEKITTFFLALRASSLLVFLTIFSFSTLRKKSFLIYPLKKPEHMLLLISITIHVSFNVTQNKYNLSRFRVVFVHLVPCILLTILTILLTQKMFRVENRRNRMLSSRRT